MKEIKLSNLEIDSIKLTHFDAYLDDKYRKPHTEGGYGFYDKSGIEHYSMLAYLSTYYNNKTILDIGTYKGGSALALSFNSFLFLISNVSSPASNVPAPFPKKPEISLMPLA